MIKVKGPERDPQAGKSGMGGVSTTGINPDPGGDTETLNAMPGKPSPSHEYKDDTAQTEPKL